MKDARGWALVDVRTDLFALPVIYPSRDAARAKAIEYGGSMKTVRVRIEQLQPVCRKGCEMIDDVPVFCKRHAPNVHSS